VTPRTAAGLIKPRPARPGSRVALVAPASPFSLEEFERGASELRRLGFEPIWDPGVFDKSGFVAGSPAHRAAALTDAWRRPDVDAIMAVRGGYGSVHVLPLLEPDLIRTSRAAFVGYSDVTSLHVYLHHCVKLASVHGPMVEGRLAIGPAAYDPASFLASLRCDPVGELRPDGVEVLCKGEAAGPLVGGTITQLLASLATPYAFDPPGGHILFLDEVGERPYRLDRMIMQLRLSGLLAKAAAIVFGQMPRCDEPGGAVTARDTVRAALEGFPGPVLFGFPSGHTVTPMLTLPLGVRTRVVTSGRPGVIIEEGLASD
jgi:muramoyltetrapeptide carboxypeptidase